MTGKLQMSTGFISALIIRFHWHESWVGIIVGFNRLVLLWARVFTLLFG